MAPKIGSWFRAVVPPPGYRHGVIVFEGLTPILMHRADFDRESEVYRAYALLGQKARKTEDDSRRLRELEWQLSLYLDPEIGPFIPGTNVKEMIREAATKWKKGEEIKRSLDVLAFRVPLEYDGPRDQQGLWDESYRFETMVANSGMNAGRVVRCRPMFPDWTLRVPIAWDPEDLDQQMVELAIERSQKYGLGDYRRASGGGFGQFTSKLVEVDDPRAGTLVDATSKPNARLLSNHEAAIAGM
jgi:hypothetical protein